MPGSPTTQPGAPSPQHPAALFYQLSLVSAGSFSMFALKWQDSIVADGKPFTHPVMQTFVIYAALIPCLACYFGRVRYLRSINHPVKEGVHVPLPSWKDRYGFLPGVAHFVATCLTNFAILFTTASAAQTFRGSGLIFGALMSRYKLGRRFQPFQIIGMAMVVGGLALVGLAAADDAESGGGGEQHFSALSIWFGCFLVVVAQFFIALRCVIEESQFKMFKVEEMQLTGLEGVAGTIVCIPCILLCLAWPYARKWDDVPLFFSQLAVSPDASMSTLLVIVSYFIQESASLGVIRHLSATTRILLSQMRTVGVWVLSMVFLEERFLWLQLLGFIILVIGTFIFKEIIPMPSGFLHSPDVEVSDGPQGSTALHSVVGPSSRREGDAQEDGEATELRPAQRSAENNEDETQPLK